MNRERAVQLVCLGINSLESLPGATALFDLRNILSVHVSQVIVKVVLAREAIVSITTAPLVLTVYFFWKMNRSKMAVEIGRTGEGGTALSDYTDVCFGGFRRGSSKMGRLVFWERGGRKKGLCVRALLVRLPRAGALMWSRGV